LTRKQATNQDGAGSGQRPTNRRRADRLWYVREGRGNPGGVPTGRGDLHGRRVGRLTRRANRGGPMREAPGAAGRGSNTHSLTLVRMPAPGYGAPPVRGIMHALRLSSLDLCLARPLGGAERGRHAGLADVRRLHADHRSHRRAGEQACQASRDLRAGAAERLPRRQRRQRPGPGRHAVSRGRGARTVSC